MGSASQRHKCEIHGSSAIGYNQCPPYGGGGGEVPVDQPVVWEGAVRIPTLTSSVAMKPVNMAKWTSGGEPITYAVTTGVLPSGLSLASDGTLSGTPAAPGVTSGLGVTGTNITNAVESALFDITVV